MDRDSMMSPMPTTWSARMMTMEWSTSDPETAAALARTVADLLRAARVAWEGLPAWDMKFHVLCKKHGAGAKVSALVWPEPHDR